MTVTTIPEVLAGNIATIISILAAASTPTPEPVAVVCITNEDGGFVTTLASPTVTVGDVTINGITTPGATVVAEWAIPDGQPGGFYTATIDTSGSLVAADEKVFRVIARAHTDPH